jgi:thioredoxin-dependent peroxiredoxin
MTIEVGDPAPDFTLGTADGETITLSDLKGKVVVLYFYPKDDTPGCTSQACAFRDNMARLLGHGAQVLGVSPDNEKSHKKFVEKFDLPFPLLADTNHGVADLYGVWSEKSMYGKKYFGNERTTFIIDREGIVRKIFPKVKVPGHVDEVIEAVEALA